MLVPSKQGCLLVTCMLHAVAGSMHLVPVLVCCKEGIGHGASFRWVSDAADTRWHSRMRMSAPHDVTSSAAVLQTPGLTSQSDLAGRRWSLRMLMCGLCALPWTSSAGRWLAGRDQAMSLYGTLRTLRPSLQPSSNGTLVSRPL